MYQAARNLPSQSAASYQRFLDEADRTYPCLIDSQDPYLGQLDYQYARAFLALNDYNSVYRHIDLALSRDPETPHPFEYRLLALRAHLYANTGNPIARTSALLKASRLVPKSDLVFWLNIFQNLGSTYQTMRDYENAQKLYHFIATELGQMDSSLYEVVRGRARAFRQEANLLIETETDLDRAILLSKQCLSLLEPYKQITGSQGPGYDLVFCAYLLGDAYSYHPKRDQFETEINKAYALAESFRQIDDHPNFPIVLAYKRARAAMQLGNIVQADQLFDLALSRVHESVYPDYLRRAYQYAANLHEHQGLFAEAALLYQNSIEIVEAYRANLGSQEAVAQAFSEWQAPYRGLIRVLLAQGKTTEAFEMLAASQARFLRDQRVMASMKQQLSEADQDTLRTLADSLVTVSGKLYATDLDQTTRRNLEAARLSLVQQRDSLLAFVPGNDSIDVTALQQTLAEQNQVLLAYFIDDGISEVNLPQRSHLFIATPDSIHAIPLDANSNDILQLLRQVSPLLTGETAEITNEAAQFKLAPLHSLYQRLIEPAKAFIPDDARLVVIPDGPLFLLPPGLMLTAYDEGMSYAEAPYLFRDHPVSVDLSAALLLDADAAPAYDQAAAPQLVAFGKSTFEDASLPTTFRQATRERLAPLPGVNEELAMLSRLFDNIATFEDDETTEAQLRSLPSVPDVFHVASHAVFNAQTPGLNAIILTPEGEDDGILHSYELTGSRLANRLVVISGCDTARGRIRTGEGMAGLQYAFRATGVPSTLATLWVVEDGLTVELMEGFYQRLLRGQAKDLALQQAQLAFLKEVPEQYHSPFYWSAPVLYGAPSAIAPKPSRMWLLWVLGILLVGLCIVGYVRHRSNALG